MEIRFMLQGLSRKELVKAVSEITGVKSKYKGMPTCAYDIGALSVSKDAVLTIPDNWDGMDLDAFFDRLLHAGFDFEMPETEQAGRAEEHHEVGNGEEVRHETECTADTMAVKIPLGFVPGDARERLRKLVDAKAELLKKALGCSELKIVEDGEYLSFPWFILNGLEGEGDAYGHLVSALCNMAVTQTRVSAVPRPIENEKYAFRCFLLRLGFIGDRYKTDRKILLRNLEGSGAFKGGRRDA